jgi:hypothetical protein
MEKEKENENENEPCGQAVFLGGDGVFVFLGFFCPLAGVFFSVEEILESDRSSRLRLPLILESVLDSEEESFSVIFKRRRLDLDNRMRFVRRRIFRSNFFAKFLKLLI